MARGEHGQDDGELDPGDSVLSSIDTSSKSAAAIALSRIPCLGNHPNATLAAFTVAVRIAFLYLTKAALDHVLSPSPHNHTDFAVFLALVHQAVLYMVSFMFQQSGSSPPLDSFTRLRLVLAISLSSALSYWSLVKFPLEVFQLLGMLTIPWTLIRTAARSSAKSILPIISACLLLIAGVAWSGSDLISSRASVYSISVTVINFGVVLPWTAHSVFATAKSNVWTLVRATAPGVITVLVISWFVLEALQATIVLLPQFWTASIFVTVCASALFAVLTAGTLRNSTLTWGQNQLAMLLVILTTLWIGGEDDIDVTSIAGVAAIVIALGVHLCITKHVTRVTSYAPMVAPLRSARPAKFSRSTHVLRNAIFACVVLFSCFAMLFVLPRSASSRAYLPIEPFDDRELLQIPGNVTMGFDQVYVINLVRRNDRRETMAARLHKLGIKATITPATTYDVPMVVDRMDLIHTKPLWGWWPFGTHLTKGELALTVSQLRIMKDVVHRGHAWALVMEDDVQIEVQVEDIWESLRKSIPTNADLLYLGYCDNGPGELVASINPPPGLPIGYSLNIATHPSCAHAYAVSLSAAKKILDVFDAPHNPYDDGMVELVNLGVLTAYSVHPALIDQDDTTVSDLQVRGWWLPIKLFFRRLTYNLRGVVLDQYIIQPVQLDTADMTWVQGWRKANELYPPWSAPQSHSLGSHIIA
ncbi:hypothetical protein HKX48_005642 [Thoreauomyces humboldtii]|nr:hypothetical protein HKX48_005642 [Thoreauomyces humboldtii]